MRNLSRRSFIRSTGWAIAGAAIFPNLISCSKNGVVNLAFVGVGGRAISNINGLITKEMKDGKRVIDPNVRVVALCDVDDRAAAQAYRNFPQAKRFKDFRTMLDKIHREIDAVVVSTPDHTHFAATMAAMQLGKHVYVEKPLAHNIWQLRTLKKAENYYGVITLLGNQGHASDGIRDVKEWYDQGLVGQVTEVHAWFNGPRFDPGGWFCKPDQYPPRGERIPDGLDWDLWLGPARKREYSHFYLPRFWRSYYEFGTGMLGDWGCHTLDAAFWALELGAPTVIEPVFVNPSEAPTDFIPNQSVLRFHFPERNGKPAVTLMWYEGGKKPENRPEWGFKQVPANGSIMVGDKMSVYAGGKPWDRRPLLPKEEKEAFFKKGWSQTIRRIPGIEKEKQYREFIDAIRGDGPLPGSHFAYGASLTEVCLLGAMAQRFNKRLEYDAEAMQFTNQPELNQYIKEEVRSGWNFGEELWT